MYDVHIPTDTKGTTMYLTTGHTARREPEVRYTPFPKNPEMEVQVFLGDSSHALYMNVDEARAFAIDLLAALPTVIEA